MRRRFQIKLIIIELIIVLSTVLHNTFLKAPHIFLILVLFGNYFIFFSSF